MKSKEPWAEYQVAAIRCAQWERAKFGFDLKLWWICGMLGDQQRKEITMNASSILHGKSPDVFDVTTKATLIEAAQIMDEKRIGAVLVRGEDGQVCGVLSERDISRQIARKGAAALNRPVTDCMSRKVITAHPNDSLDDLMNTMTDRRIRHLPVVEDDTLRGMISIGDVVKHKLAEAEAETQAMHDYIAAG